MLKFNDTTIFTQRYLKSCGLYTGKVDGIAGQKTATALADFERAYYALRDKYGKLDKQSEESIVFLVPEVQKCARKFMDQYVQLNYKYQVRLISGLRTYAEQTAIYNQGRTTPGKIVTKAKAGFSFHNFGLAWDVGLYKDGQYLQNEAHYIEFGKLIASKILMVDWGGGWKSFKDNPHYQYRTGLGISEIRRRFENEIIIVNWNGV